MVTDEATARRMRQASVLDTKSATSTEETGWSIQPPGDLSTWDGLSRWFLEEVERDPAIRDDAMVASYERATRPLADRLGSGGAP